MNVKLWELTWQEVKALVPDRVKGVFLPVGTMEAHGVIPQGTDTIIPLELSLKLAEEMSCLVAPPIYYGITNSLLGYPGSMRISSELFTEYLVEILLGLSDIGFEYIVVMNGHGGQSREIKDAIKDAYLICGTKMIGVEWWILCQAITESCRGEAGGHAGLDETAMIMAIYPELVHRDTYTHDMCVLIKQGVRAYPAPGPILLYKNGEGAPKWGEDKSKEYFERVKEAVKVEIERVRDGWRKMGL